MALKFCVFLLKEKNTLVCAKNIKSCPNKNINKSVLCQAKNTIIK